MRSSERILSRFSSERVQFICVLISLLLLFTLFTTRGRNVFVDNSATITKYAWLKVDIRDVKIRDTKMADVILRVQSSDDRENLFPQKLGDILRRRFGISSKIVDEFSNTSLQISKHVDNQLNINKSPLLDITKRRFPLTLYTDFTINNPDICSNVKGVLFLIIVHTAPKHFQRRRWLRETWANRNVYQNANVRLVFLFGEPDHSDTQALIENESNVYGDVVQGKFIDSYKNLTLKGVMGLRWITEHCPKVDFIIKVDDDVFVDMFHIIDKIYPVYGNRPRQLLCQVRAKGTSRIERDHSKWTVSANEFRNETFYPTYCNGYAVFMTGDVASLMHKAAFSIPFFWIDDVYLFGLLPQRITGFTWVNIGKSFTLSYKIGLESFLDAKPNRFIVSSAWQRDVMEQMWYSTLRKLPVSSRKFADPLLMRSVIDVIQDVRAEETNGNKTNIS